MGLGGGVNLCACFTYFSNLLASLCSWSSGCEDFIQMSFEILLVRQIIDEMLEVSEVNFLLSLRMEHLSSYLLPIVIKGVTAKMSPKRDQRVRLFEPFSSLNALTLRPSLRDSMTKV